LANPDDTTVILETAHPAKFPEVMDRALGPSRVANYQLLVPAFTVVLAAIVLGEAILVGQVVGGAVIVIGILIARRAPLGPPPGGRRVPEPAPLLEV
jgi:urea transporter